MAVIEANFRSTHRVVTAASPSTARTCSTSTSLQALTAAALVLPGMLFSPAHAADANGDSLTLQHSRFEEHGRNLLEVDSNLKPIVVDSIQTAARFTLRENLRLKLDLVQDAWSGATPVSTAPVLTHGNRPILLNAMQGVVTAGASPYVNTQLLLDRNYHPVTLADNGDLVADTRNVLIMSSASPEIRQQGDIAVEHEGSAGLWSVGAGISDEADYLSRFANFSGRLDLNQKLTSVNVGLGYTHSKTAARLDEDLLPYLTRSAYGPQLERSGKTDLLRGTRHDVQASAGLTQVLDAASLVDLRVGVNSSSGFMENPYKAMTVVFVAPNAFATASQRSANGDVRALLEQRPDSRQQWSGGAQYARHLARFDAALHVDYQYSHDNWDIASHSLEAQWLQPVGDWTFTPRLRYYTQSAASFYAPWLLSKQAYRSTAKDSAGREIWLNANNAQQAYYRDSSGNFTDAAGTAVDAALLNLQPQPQSFDPQLLPAHFSSDHRLGGFGTASAALTVSRSFARGLTFEAGVEYYRRASALQAGSAATTGFADVDSVMFNLSLATDLQATPRRLRREAANQNATHAAHTDAVAHDMHQAPAGLLFAHAPAAAGTLMLGYMVTHARQYGAMLQGTASVSDQRIVSEGCSSTVQCRYRPVGMQMNMYMPHVMYALTNSFSLMLMPQFMTMDMQLRELAGRPPVVPGVHEHGSSGMHASTAVGDTTVAALYSLQQAAAYNLHGGVGISAPTGKIDQAYRRTFRSDGGLQHFDMQTGSGTWDLLPSLTLNGSSKAWHWGLQVAGIKRLQHRNDSGYRLGDKAQATLWAGHPLLQTLSASVRAVYTRQGSIDGDFSGYNARSGPMDFPANQGGRYWDMGLGLTANMLGNTLALEWLQPVRDDVNGFQLERQGSLSASWQYGF